MNKGIAARTAAAVVGNDGIDPFENEALMADVVTAGSKLSADKLITDQTSRFEELVTNGVSLKLIERLKFLVDYFTRNPQAGNIFSDIVEITEKIKQEQNNKEIEINSQKVM